MQWIFLSFPGKYEAGVGEPVFITLFLMLCKMSVSISLYLSVWRDVLFDVAVSRTQCQSVARNHQSYHAQGFLLPGGDGLRGE